MPRQKFSELTTVRKKFVAEAMAVYYGWTQFLPNGTPNPETKEQYYYRTVDEGQIENFKIYRSEQARQDDLINPV